MANKKETDKVEVLSYEIKGGKAKPIADDEIYETEKSIYDILMDDEDNDNIFLFDEDGKEVEFEQIATVPLNGKIYAVLQPVDDPEIEDDEAVVFQINAEDDEIEIVEDDDIAEKVLDILNKKTLELMKQEGDKK